MTKMSRTKRLMSLVLAILMLTSILPPQTLAANIETGESITAPTQTPSDTVTVPSVVKPCAACGVVGCESTHDTWCGICKKDDCDAEHVWCDTCKLFNCGKTHEIDPVEPEPEVPAEPSVINRLVILPEGVYTYVYTDPNNFYTGVSVGKSSLADKMIIREVTKVGSITYYRVYAADNSAWPSDSNAPEGCWIDSAKVEFIGCPVCYKENCTTQHIQCDICKGYDCLTIHFWCDFCQKYECGKAHVVCRACGEIDCKLIHKFCTHCGDFDCQINHVDDFKPVVTPAIPANPNLSADKNVSIVDGEGNVIGNSGLTVEEGTRTSISAWLKDEASKGTVTYQWQVCYNLANDQWIDIEGETRKGILVSEAMVSGVVNYQGKTAIRCIASWSSGSYISPAIAVTVEKTVSKSARMMSAAPKARSAAAPVAEGQQGTIIIEYKFRDDQKAANSWTANLTVGNDYVLDVKSPDVVGYKPSVERVQENIINFSGSRVITVYYDPDIVNFTVIHHQQNIVGGNYTPVKQETKRGTTGTAVGVNLETEEYKDGFRTMRYDDTLIIAADGSTIVNIYYDRRYFMVSLNLNGGYGAEPMYARYETPIIIADPLRTGYVFNGWSPALPDKILKNTSHTAQWTQAETEFVVAFWYENANDNNYTFVGSVKQTGNTGTKVNGYSYRSEAFDGRDDDHFTYSHADSNVEIKADKSTVVNVYFKRNTYTLTYLSPICSHIKKEQHNGDCCTITYHDHSSGCSFTKCGKTAHDHSTGRNSECNEKTCSYGYEHTHSKSCVTNDLYKVSDNKEELENKYGTSLPNGTEKTLDGGWLVGTMYFVIFDGVWYRCWIATQDFTWKCGGNKSKLTAHTHTTACCDAQHIHTSSCCAVTVHTHTSDCNTSKCKHQAAIDAKNPYGCPCSFDSDDLWEVYVSEKGVKGTKTFKYQQDVSGFHASMDDHRWCPGLGSGFANEKDYGKSLAVGTFSSMHGNDVVFYLSSRGANPYKFVFWLESADGTSGTRNYKGYNFVQSTTFTPRMGAVGYVGDYQAGRPFGFKDFEAWASDSLAGANVEELKAPDSSFGGEYTYYNFYYIRSTHTLTYFNGSTKVATETMKFEEPLTDAYNKRDLNLVSPYGDGYQFAGWYLDANCSIRAEFDGSEKMPDGGMALYAKWTPKIHKVYTYRTKGGEKLNGSGYDIPHGEIYSGTIPPVYNDPYTFVGWFYEDEVTGEEKAYDFSMPVYRDMNLYAKWSSDTQVFGTIRYIDRDTGKPVADPIPIQGMLGATKTYDAKIGSALVYEGVTYTGYFPETPSHNIEFSENESQNDWIFYYKAMEAVSYKVEYRNAVTKELMPGVETIEGTTKDPTLSFRAVTIKGYSADAIEKTLVVSSDEKLNVITFYYTEDTVHAPVQVIHYIQDLKKNESDPVTYTKYLTEQPYQGTIGKVEAAKPLTITGFSYNATKSNASAELTADGLILELYYDRNSYGYEFRFEDTNGNTLRDPIIGPKVPYGTLVKYTATTIPGYRLTVGSETITISENESTNVKTFIYEERTVTIHYQLGAGSVGSLSKDKETVLAATGSALGATASNSDPNYKFVGWYSDFGCTHLISDKATIIPNKDGEVYVDTTYYAKFEEIKVTIWYEVEMPAGAQEQATLNKYSELVSIFTGRATGGGVASIPNGYEFDGWYLNGTKVSSDPNYVPPRPEQWVDGTKYVAKFVEKKVTINYIAVGPGSVSLQYQNDVNMLTGTPKKVTATVKEHYGVFKGWYSDAELTQWVSNDLDFVPTRPADGWAESQTYYAKFEYRTYTITFVDRGQVKGTQEYSFGDMLKLPDGLENGNYHLTWTLGDAENTNWTSELLAAFISGNLINCYGNVTIEASWTIDVYWINWDGNYANLNQSVVLKIDESVPYGTPHIYNGTTPTRVDPNGYYTYAFEGNWEIIDPKALVGSEIDGVVVYLAQYTETANEYTVIFDANGGDAGIMENQTMTYGTAHALNANAFSRTDYAFMGWNTAADGSGTSYTNGQEVLNLAPVSDKTITLYAMWDLSLVSIVITTSNTVDDNQSYIFTVSGKTADNRTVNLTVALGANDEQKIVNLPVGEYTVSDQQSWSWRYAGTTLKKDVNSVETTFAFNYNRVEKVFWLNSYGNDLLQTVQSNKRKK